MTSRHRGIDLDNMKNYFWKKKLFMFIWNWIAKTECWIRQVAVQTTYLAATTRSRRRLRRRSPTRPTKHTPQTYLAMCSPQAPRPTPTPSPITRAPLQTYLAAMISSDRQQTTMPTTTNPDEVTWNVFFWNFLLIFNLKNFVAFIRIQYDHRCSIWWRTEAAATTIRTTTSRTGRGSAHWAEAACTGTCVGFAAGGQQSAHIKSCSSATRWQNHKVVVETTTSLSFFH